MVESPEFWVAVAFVIFVAATFKPVKLALTGALDNRATTIRAQIDEARRLREEAQAALAEAQRKHRDAAGEAEALIASAKEEARLLQAQAAENLETTLARREQLAMERIAQAETDASPPHRRRHRHRAHCPSRDRRRYASPPHRRRHRHRRRRHSPPSPTHRPRRRSPHR